MGNGSIALGENTTANGDASTALGRGTTANERYSTAMGTKSTAGGFASTAMGDHTEASGNVSTAMGNYTTAHGFASTAMGESTTASGDLSTAMGESTTASGDLSTAMGLSTKAESYASIAMGRNNVGGGNDNNWLSGDPIFEIGIGADSDHRINALTVLKNGNVGIGTPAPGAKLVIWVADGTSAIYVANTYGAKRFALNPNSDGSWTMFDHVGGGWVGGITQQSGNVGIGTTSPDGNLDVNGSIYQRGSSLHADYVFEDDYELESIQEHSDFMWTEKHLRAIPKSQIDENGLEIVEVGSHRKGIVEELEKAHIYIYQLEERISMLEQILLEGK